MDVRFFHGGIFASSDCWHVKSAPLVVISDYGCTETCGQARKTRHNTLLEANMLTLPILSRSHRILSATVYGLARHISTVFIHEN